MEVKIATQILLYLVQDPNKVTLRSCDFLLSLCQEWAGSEPSHCLWQSAGYWAAHREEV